MCSQKPQLLSAAEVGRVGRTKRHRRTLKPVDGVQKDLVKGRHVCESFFPAVLTLPGFSGCNKGLIKKNCHNKEKREPFFCLLAF